MGIRLEIGLGIELNRVKDKVGNMISNRLGDKVGYMVRKNRPWSGSRLN